MHFVHNGYFSSYRGHKHCEGMWAVLRCVGGVVVVVVGRSNVKTEWYSRNLGYWDKYMLIESTKATSMEDVSTGVLEKI